MHLTKGFEFSVCKKCSFCSETVEVLQQKGGQGVKSWKKSLENWLEAGQASGLIVSTGWLYTQWKVFYFSLRGKSSKI